MASKIVKISIALLLFLNTILLGQEKGNVLVISSQNATLYIDGNELGKLEKDKPFKISISIGEHLIQVISDDDYEEKSEKIEVQAGALKVVKIEFRANSIEELEEKEVSSIDLIIPGLTGGINSKDIYYAFERGDEIKVNVTMSNKNGTNSLKIKSHPEGIIAYQNLSFQGLNDASVKISKRGIYKFEFSTQHSFDRNIHLDISRKPASEETIEFNTNVYEKWTYEPISLVQSEEYTINSGLNSLFAEGKSRVLIPLNFPANTVKWYYEFSAMRNPADIKKVKENYSLFSGISNQLGPKGQIISFALENLSQPPGSDICHIYLLDYQNSSLFTSKNPFNYVLEGTRENFKSGIVEVNCCFDQPIYLGIKNPDETYAIEVLLEVVAIVQKKEITMQE